MDRRVGAEGILLAPVNQAEWGGGVVRDSFGLTIKCSAFKKKLQLGSGSSFSSTPAPAPIPWCGREEEDCW